MHAERIERKYALTKIAPGDWLLPSNDGRTIWRLAKYVEGPSHGDIDLPSDMDAWGIWRWDGGREYVDTGSWDEWEMCCGSLTTRAAAIEEALRMTYR